MYKELTQKQTVAYWWEVLPQTKHFRKAIFSGAIRTGKTDLSSEGWFKRRLHQTVNTISEERTKGWNKYFIVGATRDTIYDNVIDNLINWLENNKYKECRNYRDLDLTGAKYYINKTEGALIVRHHGVKAIFKYFGADNVRAFRKIQGRTFRGGFIDEAGIIDIKIIETLEGRCATWKDSRIVMTTNPEGDDSHPFYKNYIRGGLKKDTLVISFELIDNPIFTQVDVDYYRRIFTTAMFNRKILGKWVRDSGGIYSKFLYEKHVVTKSEIEKHNFIRHTIGVDYGETDATSFVHTGFTRNYDKMVHIDEYYHKNGQQDNGYYETKDINDYVEEFFQFIERQYKIYQCKFGVYIDSASKSFRVLIIGKAENKHFIHNGKNIYFDEILTIQAVNKTKEDIHAASAIKERIEFTNICLGAEAIQYSENCKNLITATIKAVYDDNGNRLDDGKMNIDSLDAQEYSFKDIMREMRERLIYKSQFIRSD